MADRPIQVGDLVVVVRQRRCGCYSKSYGAVFEVADIRAADDYRYYGCDHLSYLEVGAESTNKQHFVEISRLKRIPPLSELEGEKRDEEITA